MDMGAFVDTMEVSTSWDNIHNLYRNVKQAVSRSAFIMAHFSHVYPAGSSIYFTFAGFAPDGEPIEALYQRTWSEAIRAVRKSQASVAHHHGVGLAKAAHLSHDHRGGGDLMALLKARLDPDGIMNPGKLWDVRQVSGDAARAT
jgi:alkyldihydroxyacetonephosphate synthase